MFRNPFADGIVVLIILLLFFGPKRLPMLSRSIGESIKEFKGGIGSGESSDKPEISHTAPIDADAAASRETASTGSERSS
jgi:sec-independent protein translocase protein TatA